MAHVMTAEELAIYLKVSVGSIFRYAKAGQIPALKIGGVWRFDKDTIDAWLRGRKE